MQWGALPGGGSVYSLLVFPDTYLLDEAIKGYCEKGSYLALADLTGTHVFPGAWDATLL